MSNMMQALSTVFLAIMLLPLSGCDPFSPVSSVSLDAPDTVVVHNICAERYGDSWTRPEKAELVARRNFVWPHHVSDTMVFPVRFMNGSDWQHQQVKRYAPAWTKATNGKLKFFFLVDPLQDTIAAIRIRFEDGPSWSDVGNSALKVPQNEHTMLFGWVDQKEDSNSVRALILHEFGHAIGFVHEQQHPQAAIRWDTLKTYAYYLALNPTWTEATVRENVFNKFDRSETNYSGYDRMSIMHYFIPNSITRGDFEVGMRTRLSAIDQAFVKQIYPLELCPPGGMCYVNKEGDRTRGTPN